MASIQHSINAAVMQKVTQQACSKEGARRIVHASYAHAAPGGGAAAQLHLQKLPHMCCTAA